MGAGGGGEGSKIEKERNGTRNCAKPDYKTEQKQVSKTETKEKTNLYTKKKKKKKTPQDQNTSSSVKQNHILTSLPILARSVGTL